MTISCGGDQIMQRRDYSVVAGKGKTSPGEVSTTDLVTFSSESVVFAYFY